ncbi:MAG: ATP synthase subunit I [Peristeroidobacter soli]
MGTAIALQWAVILVLAAVAWIWSGKGALVLVLGGAAVALPNTVLALWLTRRMHRTGAVGVVAMFAGELLKLGFTIALLVAIVVRLKPDLSWLPLIVGVIAALKAQWLALWVTRRY